MEHLPGPNSDTALDHAEIAVVALAESGNCGGVPSSEVTVAYPDSNCPVEGCTALPRDSRITVAESSVERLVIYLPPGSEMTAVVGWLTLIWNGALAVATVPWFIFWGPAFGMPLSVRVLFFCLAGSMGLHFLYRWLRERFSQTFLMLERDRLAIKRNFLRWTRINETPLTSDTKAEIVIVGESDRDPVYAVSLAGTDRKATFGMHLSHEEKLWIVREMNQFLGVDVPEWEKIRVETIAQPLSPQDVTAASSVTIFESTPERLLLRAPLFAKEIRDVYNLIFVVVGAIGIAIAIGVVVLMVTVSPDAENTGRAIQILIGVFAAIFVAPLLCAAAIVNAKTTIELTPQFLRRRRHYGRLGLCKEVPTDAITAVFLVTTEALPSDLKGFRKRPSKPMTHYTSCVVLIGRKPLRLTVHQQRNTSEQIAGLVKNQLAAMRFQVQ